MKKAIFTDKNKYVALYIDLEKTTYKIINKEKSNNLIKTKLKELIKLGFKENENV